MNDVPEELEGVEIPDVHPGDSVLIPFSIEMSMQAAERFVESLTKWRPDVKWGVVDQSSLVVPVIVRAAE